MGRDKDKNPKGFAQRVKEYLQGALHHFLAQPVVFLLNLLITTLFSVVGAREQLAKLPEYWSNLGENWPLLLGALAVFILVFLVVSFVGKWLQAYFKHQKMLAACGLSGFHKLNAANHDIAWENCIKQIQSRSPDELRFLLFTGSKTFAKDDAPLNQALQNFKGTIKILLVNPSSEAFESRVHDLCSTNGALDATKSRVLRETLKGEIRESIAFCKALAKRTNNSRRSVELRQYQQKAVWKLVIFNDYLWAQHYQAGVRAAESECFIFSNQQRSSLFHPLTTTFDKLWTDDSTKKCELFDGNTAGKMRNSTQPQKRRGRNRSPKVNDTNFDKQTVAVPPKAE